MDCAPFSAALESPAGLLNAVSLDALLIAVAPEARYPLWQGLTRAVEGALWLWESSPAGSRRQPPPLALQHVGLPHFNPRDLCQQTLEGIHRLLRLELPLAVDVLEVLLCGKNEDAYQMLLAEQCTRVGQLYAELKRRADDLLVGLLRTRFGSVRDVTFLPRPRYERVKWPFRKESLSAATVFCDLHHRQGLRSATTLAWEAPDRRHVQKNGVFLSC